MFIVNGEEFEDDDITAVANEMTCDLNEEQMTQLINQLMLEWPNESTKGSNLMIREGDQVLRLGHIADCVSVEDGHAFIDSIQDYIDSI